MKKFNIFYAVFAILLVTSAICNETKENLVDVDDESENMTLSDVKNNDSEKDIEMESVEITTTLNELEIKNNKSETLEVETTTLFETTTQVTTTTMPSLKTLQFNPEDLNVTKSLIKEIARTSSLLRNPIVVGPIINEKMRKAIMKSKAQALKQLKQWSDRQEAKLSQDQTAFTVGIQTNLPPKNEKLNVKDFIPSPEASSLHSQGNQPQNNFIPMNNFYLPPKKEINKLNFPEVNSLSRFFLPPKKEATLPEVNSLNRLPYLPPKKEINLPDVNSFNRGNLVYLPPKKEVQQINHSGVNRQPYLPPKQEVHQSTPTPFTQHPMIDPRWFGSDRQPIGTMRPPIELKPPPVRRAFSFFNRPSSSPNTGFPFFMPIQTTQRPTPHWPSYDERFGVPFEGRIANHDNSGTISNSEEAKQALWVNQLQSLDPNQQSWNPKGGWKWIAGEGGNSDASKQNSEGDSGVTNSPTAWDINKPLSESEIAFWTNYWNNQGKPPAVSAWSNVPETWTLPSESDVSSSVTEADVSSSGKSKEKEEDEESSEEKEKGSEEDKSEELTGINKFVAVGQWKKIIGAIAAAVPIGVIISALTSRVAYISADPAAETFEEHEVTPSHNHYIVPPPAQLPYLNSYSSYSSLPMTHRSIHKRFLTDEIDATLVNSLRLMDLELRRKYQRTGQKLDGLCEDRFFCDFALKGRNVNSGALNKMLFNIALVTPEEQADKSGLGKIFKAVKRLNCDVFKCDKKL